MSLTIVVNGGGTFTASMEEGPVSFTASLAAVGPQGPAGAAGQGVPVGGATGEVLAKASGTDYDTEWVARNPFNQDLNTGDNVSFSQIFRGTITGEQYRVAPNDVWAGLYDGTDVAKTTINSSGVTFPDSTTQSTALPSGLADGYIVAWNADNSAYDSVPNDARTLFLVARNNTGTIIAKGKAVYISGSTGNQPEITLAIATSEATSARTIGITSEAIANNGTGRVIVAGLLENVDTSAFSAGDVLYLSSSSAGGFQTTLPTQPNHGVLLGYVTRSNNSTGVIEVRVDNYQELGEQSDVLLTSKANGDFLVYESATSLWKNRTLASLDLLTATAAAAVYQPLSGMGSYLTTSAAASTYYPLTGNPSGFLVSGDLSGYLLSSTAATTYAPIVHTHTASAVTDFDTAADARVNALVPAASTTAAGKVELATDAEAVAGTSATLAVTPQSFLIANLSTGYYSNLVNGGAGATAGLSAGSASTDAGGRVFTGTTSGAYALRRIGPGSIYPLSIGRASGVINYDKRVCLSVLMTSNQYVSNSNIRCLLGKSLTDNNGNLAGKGIGVMVTGTGVLELQIHDGTTLTNVSSSFTPVANQAFDVLVDSDGSGNVTLYVNGSSVATSSAGPTGNSVNTLNAFHFEAETTDTLVAQTIAGFSRHQLFFGR